MGEQELLKSHEKRVSESEKRFIELEKSFKENPQFDLCRDVVDALSYSQETHIDYYTVLALLDREFKYLTKLENLNLLLNFHVAVDEMLYVVAKSFMLQLGNDIICPVVTEEGEESSTLFMLKSTYTPPKKSLDDVKDSVDPDEVFECIGDVSLVLEKVDITPKVVPFNNTYKYPREGLQTRPDKWALLNTLAVELAHQFNCRALSGIKRIYAEAFTHPYVKIPTGSFVRVLNDMGDAIYNLSSRGGITAIIAHDHVLEQCDIFHNTRFEGTTCKDLHALRTTCPDLIKVGTFMGVKIFADHSALAEDDIIAIWANEAIAQERPVIVGMGIPLLISNNFGELSLASEYVCIAGSPYAMFIGKMEKFKLDLTAYTKRGE